MNMSNSLFFNKTIYEFSFALLLFFSIWLFTYILKKHLVPKFLAKKELSSQHFDEAAFLILSQTNNFLFFTTALYISSSLLPIPGFLKKVILLVFLLTISRFIIKSLGILSDFVVIKSLKNKHPQADLNSPATMSAQKNIRIIVNIVLWCSAVLFILSNLGFNITSLVAGVGIGGIAIALAVQNILGDTFNSLVIYLDKPFEVGDHIVVDQTNGIVEYIGLKTTRIAALTGEQIIISNTDLTKARIQNFKKMRERRVAFTLSLTNKVPVDVLEKIPAVLRE